VAEVVAQFSGYTLYSDGQLRIADRGWDVKGCRAEFTVGPPEYGPSMGMIVVMGAAGAGAVDKTKCVVTVIWPNGAQLKMEAAAAAHQWGEQMARAINDISGLSAQPGPQWAADPSGRHQVRYYNGWAWTEHVSDNGAPGVDPL
jgi:hypothetical protein